MDFHQLLAKMQELDTPAVQPEVSVQECGEPMGMTPPMSAPAAPHNPPSLSVNLNAQGMDDIESIMRLMTKVNPDMINQPDTAKPTTLTTVPGLGSLGNLDSGPLKMLPDLDKEPEITPVGGDKMNGPDDVTEPEGDLDHDGDHDMDDHDMEKDDKPEDEGLAGAAIGGVAGAAIGKTPAAAATGASMGSDAQDAMAGDEPEAGAEAGAEEDDEEEQEEAFGNSPTGASDTQYKDAEYMTKDLAGGMNREKQQFKHSYRAGDNPMAMGEADLRAYIKAELAQRLTEAKAKLSK